MAPKSEQRMTATEVQNARHDRASRPSVEEPVPAPTDWRDFDHRVIQLQVQAVFGVLEPGTGMFLETRTSNPIPVNEAEIPEPFYEILRRAGLRPVRR
jgi:hypothetical protein